MTLRVVRFAISALAGALLGACGQGERAFLQVQFCLTGLQDVERLKAEFQQIARDEKMTFLDRSVETQAELENVGNPGDAVETSFPLINIGVEKGVQGYGVSGGNLGLGPKQVALGFGPDSPVARAFARRVVAKLNRHWALKPVPPELGVRPLDCSKELTVKVRVTDGEGWKNPSQAP